MTNKVKEAIEVLRALPEDDQDTVAAAIIDFASHDERMMLSDEQVLEVERRMANPDRKFVSIAEARKRLRHYGV